MTELGGLGAPTVVRLSALEPRWTTPHATEEPYLRWLVTWVGGPPGHINPSPESGLTSDGAVVGLMGMPAGNRQYGFHVHGITEIYVVLRGMLRSVGPGTEHVAAPLDCIVIPPGVAHAVEAVGDEDALFLWAHDRPEREGAAAYHATLEDAAPAAAAIDVVPWASLAVEAGRTGGLLHERRRWTAEPLAIEALDIAAASAEPPHVAERAEVAVVTHGTAVVRATGETLGPLDALVVPAGATRQLAAAALEPSRVVVFS